ncbi:hypothetical protein CTAYLR_007064 [Chrysophaeum taylorii]|uniref:Uncharacterized protein n=1 Tax=Chrysophaeum taylorii TaxID=2483200 RepID=A0AAD7ULJ9_9STRA|nr:hypothetical protein CTAYLR_007064 [Chrysophaeum taylorii]
MTLWWATVGHCAEVCDRCFGTFDKERTSRRLRWLHFPKAGLTFQETIYRWACPNLGAFNGRSYVKLHRESRRDPQLLESYCDRQVDGTMPGHPPVDERMLDRTVAMFRDPSQRIISAFRDRKHADGFQDEDKEATWRHLNQAAFARHPGIAGCMTRMLQNGKCARARRVRDNFSALGAASNVRRLAFVGLVEHWNTSICLFHKVFGGKPQPDQFKIGHSSRANEMGRGRTNKLVPYDTKLLDGFVDADDELVYNTAKEVFEGFLSRFAPNCSSQTLLHGN